MKLLILIVSLTIVKTQPLILHNSTINNNNEEKGIQVGDPFHPLASVSEVDSKINELIGQFGLSLNEYYEEKLNEAKIEFLNFARNSTYFRKIEISKIEDTVIRLKDGLTNVSNLRKPLSDPFMLKRIIYNSVYDISEFRLSEIYMKNVSFQAEILNFLLIDGNITFQSPDHWLNTMQNVSDYFSTSLNVFTKSVAKGTSEIIYSSILSDLRFIAKTIKKHCSETIYNSLESLNFCYLPLMNLSIESYYTSDLFTFLDNVVNCVKKYNIDEYLVEDVLKKISYLELVQGLSERPLLRVIPFMAFQPFKDVFKFVRESHEWYYFLKSLSMRLSEYEIQSDASRYNVEKLDDWGNSSKKQGISIDKHNFHHFLDKLSHVFIDDDIRSMEISASQLNALDKIFESHFRSKYEAICENKDKILLRGNFVKFSNFIDENGVFKNPCHFQTPNITIYAAKTVFIDRNLNDDGSGFKISIIAPRWEVIGHSRLIAVGSFMGIGRLFVNGDQLRISSIGGKVNIIELGPPSKIIKS